MPRKVLIARGGAVGPASGLGRAHHDLVSSLQSNSVKGFEIVGIHEHPLGGNPFKRLYRRWRGHPKSLEKKVKQTLPDLLHISDQEHAILIPKNCPVPVSITVHDLFHLDPQKISTPDGDVWIGERNTGIIRNRDLVKMKAGLSRADLLICDSKTTESHAKKLFPDKKTVVLPLGLDCQKRNPLTNPLPYPSQFSNEKMNLLIIGSEDPRKRLHFAIEVIGNLPIDVRSNIVVHKIGAESSLAAKANLESIAQSSDVKVQWWGRTGEEELIAAEQHADALLFPSIAEGFGYPPLEAMAAGCPVLMADMGSHNELAIPGTPLSPYSTEPWVEELLTLHGCWLGNQNSIVENGDYLRPVDEAGLARAAKYDKAIFAEKLESTWTTFLS
jgi:glycosyltransferase involved in cell wall biosynthesis